MRSCPGQLRRRAKLQALRANSDDCATCRSRSAKWSTAFTRFGLGARGRDAPASGDPREALSRRTRRPPRRASSRRSGSADPPQAMALLFIEYNDRAQARRRPSRAVPSRWPEPAPAPPGAVDGRRPSPRSKPVNDTFQGETRARARGGDLAPRSATSSGLWRSGPTISAFRRQQELSWCAFLAGAFEREAIRPYVLGPFRDMTGGRRRAIRRC